MSPGLQAKGVGFKVLNDSAVDTTNPRLAGSLCNCCTAPRFAGSNSSFAHLFTTSRLKLLQIAPLKI